MRNFIILTLPLLLSLTGCEEQSDTELALCEQQAWDLFVENEELQSDLEIADALIRALEYEKEDRASKVITEAYALGREMSDGIERVNDHHYEVDHGLYVKYGLDKDVLQLFGRAIPHRGMNGEIDGLRLSGIRRGTPGERIGLRNGDIVVAINGRDFRGYGSYWSSMSDIEYISSTTVEVIRRGERISLRYDFIR